MGRLKNRIPELLQRKGIRDDTRYTQRDMAIGSGLSDGAISRMIRYEYLDNVPFINLYVVAQWLEVSIEELARLEE